MFLVAATDFLLERLWWERVSQIEIDCRIQFVTGRKGQTINPAMTRITVTHLHNPESTSLRTRYVNVLRGVMDESEGALL